MLNLMNAKIELEFFGVISVYLAILIQIIFSIVLGGLIGLDREIKMKAAGFKTNIMICLGATIYTSISMLNLQDASSLIDPNRVSAQIVSGIGFLGAGAIIQGRGSIVGLTTAATIWVVAAIGFTIGTGYPIVATLFAFAVLITLRLGDPTAILSERNKNFKSYHIELLSHGVVAKIVKEILSHENVRVNQVDEKKFKEDSEEILTDIYLISHPRAMERIIFKINEIIRIKKINYNLLES